MDLIPRSKLPGHLARFGMPFGDAGLEAALRATGIRPTKYQGIAGGKGRIALLDPMVCWLLVAVWEANKRRFRGVSRELETFRKLYDKLVENADCKYVPGFEDDREFGAQLLLLTSPAWGLEPRDIRRIVKKDSRVLDYSMRGREFLVVVLQAYNNVYGRTIAGLSIDPGKNPRQKASEQMLDFAEAWLHEARLLFEIEAHNADVAGALGSSV